MTVQELARRAERLAVEGENEVRVLMADGRLREAKSVADSVVRDLRDVNRDIADEKRAIRERAAGRREKNNRAGQTVGLFTSGSAHKAVTASRAAANRHAARDQRDELRPLDDLKSGIDRTIANFARIKAQIGDDLKGIVQRPAALPAETPVAEPLPRAVPSPVTSPMPAAGFYPDPQGMARERFWDGGQWTARIRM